MGTQITLWVLLWLCITTSAAAQWTQARGPEGEAIGGHSFFVVQPPEGGDILWVGTGTTIPGKNVYRTTDGGNDWQPIGPPIPVAIEALAALPNGPAATDVLAGGTDEDHARIVISSSNGVSWASGDSGMPTSGYGRVNSLVVDGSVAFAGVSYGGRPVLGGVFQSTDRGRNWSICGSGLPNGGNIRINRLLSANDQVGGSILFAACGYTKGVYRSMDHGSTWTPALTGLTDTSVWALAAHQGTVLAGTRNGLCRSTDCGSSWNRIGLDGVMVTCISVDASNLFAGTLQGERHRLLHSSDDGKTWTSIDSGLPDDYVSALAVANGYLFAGFDASGVWRRSLSDVTTSVEDRRVVSPMQFRLSQNFPNPFNPVTGIRIQVPGTSHVRLAVYDLLGREVAVLLDEQKAPGRYQVEFDGMKLSSGVYFYRLNAGAYVETKRMMLLR
jgi:hypothetical protein